MVPQSIAFFSGTIKDVYESSIKFSESPDSPSIHFNELDAGTLEKILKAVVKIKLTIENEYCLPKENHVLVNNHYVASNITRIISSLFNNESIDTIQHMTHATHFLDIPFLTNALVNRRVVKKISTILVELKNISIDDFLPLPFAIDIHPLIFKHIHLLKFELEEYTLADHLAFNNNVQSSLIRFTSTDTCLDLSNLKLTSLEGIEQLENAHLITKIDISFNNLCAIDRNSLSLFENVHSINLSNNFFIEIPENIPQLPNLEHLDIRNNQLNELSTLLFSNFSKLKNLYLSGNNLSVDALLSLPESIRQLPSVIELIEALELTKKKNADIENALEITTNLLKQIELSETKKRKKNNKKANCTIS